MQSPVHVQPKIGADWAHAARGLDPPPTQLGWFGSLRSHHSLTALQVSPLAPHEKVVPHVAPLGEPPLLDELPPLDELLVVPPPFDAAPLLDVVPPLGGDTVQAPWLSAPLAEHRKLSPLTHAESPQLNDLATPLYETSQVHAPPEGSPAARSPEESADEAHALRRPQRRKARVKWCLMAETGAPCVPNAEGASQRVDAPRSHCDERARPVASLCSCATSCPRSRNVAQRRPSVMLVL